MGSGQPGPISTSGNKMGDVSGIYKTCARVGCGESFFVPRRRIGSARFCSKSCMDLAMTLPTRDCAAEGCIKQVKGKHKFCSKDCDNKTRKGKPGPRNKNAGTLRSEWWVGTCQGPDCCNIVARRMSEVQPNGVYCSRACFLRTGINLPRTGRPNLPIGTRSPNPDGYIRVKIGTGNKAWRMEHMVEMETLLGRRLLPHENVHHINGDKTDNRTEGPLVNFRSGNLELWSTDQPKGQRVEDKVAWAKEILALYQPEALQCGVDAP